MLSFEDFATQLTGREVTIAVVPGVGGLGNGRLRVTTGGERSSLRNLTSGMRMGRS